MTTLTDTIEQSASEEVLDHTNLEDQTNRLKDLIMAFHMLDMTIKQLNSGGNIKIPKPVLMSLLARSKTMMEMEIWFIQHEQSLSEARMNDLVEEVADHMEQLATED